MTKRKYIRLVLFSFFLVAASIALVPRFLSSPAAAAKEHSMVKLNAEPNLDAAPDENDDLAKYEKPVYFNLFKFIGSLVPNRQRQSGGL